ncbi:hypothetical protein HG530_010618 [Fusarium avenaceum]|nr:hypothetical protein HG530_010618 [Fusarium avenaceum]
MVTYVVSYVGVVIQTRKVERGVGRNGNIVQDNGRALLLAGNCLSSTGCATERASSSLLEGLELGGLSDGWCSWDGSSIACQCSEENEG